MGIPGFGTAGIVEKATWNIGMMGIRNRKNSDYNDK
jgi:hypothetical protein